MVKVSSLFLFSFSGVLLASSTSAQGTICCVCSDDCVSTITNPDATLALPANPMLPVSEATCEQIRHVAEDLMLIPPEYCSQFDIEEFRVLCGCEVRVLPIWTTNKMRPYFRSSSSHTYEICRMP